ncbi:Hsp70 family protein [Lentzea guizhouensis]|uniref:Hsp70 family protein n=1 Tax=Lentzea guizhouensis TaxID=1586287 RepID=UPI001F315DF9|nr:Hsp70 family protein [Lentzea guizhouensis]
MNTKAFGIDLGTTHSVLAHVDYSGRPVVVANTLDEEITPSTVYFEAPFEVTVGTTAKNSAIVEPRNYSQLVKRHMGAHGVHYPHHGHDYSPVEISALVLKYLAECGRRATGVVVQDVVITVPAHFGVAERNATRAAGTIAGLTVRDVIVEPVAAALHYGYGRADEPGVRHVLVCDLGGGTCDTTVIRIEGDRVQVVCTKGEGDLGGADWDERVLDHLVDEFVRQHPRVDPTADPEFMYAAAQRAEELKKELSSAQTRHTDLRFTTAVARVELTRTELEELTSDLLDRVVDLTRRTVEEAGRKGVRDLDDVLLVGGMTKSPAVGAALRERLGLEPKLHEPHLAVAKGAAIHASQRQVLVSEEVRGEETGIGRLPATVVAGDRSEGDRPQRPDGGGRPDEGADARATRAPGRSGVAGEERPVPLRDRGGELADGPDRGVGAEQHRRLDGAVREQAGGQGFPAQHAAQAQGSAHPGLVRDVGDRRPLGARLRPGLPGTGAVRAADRRPHRTRRRTLPRVDRPAPRAGLTVIRRDGATAATAGRAGRRSARRA